MRRLIAGSVVCLAVACADRSASGPKPISPVPPSSARAASSSACPEPDEPEPAHRALWQDAKALERKEQWADMEAKLSRAEQLAPSFANYSYKRGYALTQLGSAATEPALKHAYYERAIAPLNRCLAVDPALAECHHFLADALLATHRTQAALEHYDRAIRTDPTTAYFYPPYVEALIALKEYDAAIRVANEGIRRVWFHC